MVGLKFLDILASNKRDAAAHCSTFYSGVFHEQTPQSQRTRGSRHLIFLVLSSLPLQLSLSVSVYPDFYNLYFFSPFFFCLSFFFLAWILFLVPTNLYFFSSFFFLFLFWFLSLCPGIFLIFSPLFFLLSFPFKISYTIAHYFFISPLCFFLSLFSIFSFYQLSARTRSTLPLQLQCVYYHITPWLRPLLTPQCSEWAVWHHKLPSNYNDSLNINDGAIECPGASPSNFSSGGVFMCLTPAMGSDEGWWWWWWIVMAVKKGFKPIRRLGLKPRWKEVNWLPASSPPAHFSQW